MLNLGWIQPRLHAQSRSHSEIRLEHLPSMFPGKESGYWVYEGTKFALPFTYNIALSRLSSLRFAQSASGRRGRIFELLGTWRRWLTYSCYSIGRSWTRDGDLRGRSLRKRRWWLWRTTMATKEMQYQILT